jgi:hypothetical protein
MAGFRFLPEPIPKLNCLRALTFAVCGDPPKRLTSSHAVRPVQEFLQGKKSCNQARQPRYADRSTWLRLDQNPGAIFVAQHVPSEIGTCAIASREEVFRRRRDKCV